MKELICIMCPKGCHLKIDEEKNVTGNQCILGVKYAINEVTNPTRIVTSTVKIKSELISRLPVISEKEVPKAKVFEVVKALDSITVQAPIKLHDVVLENVCGLGINIIATRTIDK